MNHAHKPQSEKVFTARSVYARTGYAFFAMAVVTLGIQMALVTLLENAGIFLASRIWLIFLISQGPLLLIGLPLLMLILRKVPSALLQKEPLGAGQTLMFFVICITLMYAGNIIGLIFSATFGQIVGYGSINQVQELILGSEMWSRLLFVALLAPITEEIIFRKLLIDKTVQYGQRTAILLSGLFFGLFHGNFYQFFYAFGLGLLFAFVYVKTGKLLYTIGLHMLVNSLGSLLAPYLLTLIDLAAIESAVARNDLSAIMAIVDDSLAGLLLLGFYALIMIGLALTGLVLLIIKRKMFAGKPGTVYLTSADTPAEPDELFPPQTVDVSENYAAALLNPGTLLFIIVCLGLFLLNLLNIMI